MRKKILSLFILSLLIITVKAQESATPSLATPKARENKKYSIAVSVGPAIVYKDFASNNIKNSFWDSHATDTTHLQGFAKRGFHLDISASLYITDYVGLMLFIGGNSNPFDINTFSNAIGLPATNISGNYYTAEYMLGPFVSFKLLKNMNLKVSVLGGRITNNYPTLSIVTADTTVGILFNGAADWAYCIGAGLEYNIGHNIYVSLNLSYTQTTITYSGVLATFYVPASGRPAFMFNHYNDDTSMSAGILKPTIGVVWRL